MKGTEKRGFQGFEMNHDSGGLWAVAIGKLLINFGALEMLSYMWIDRLAHNQILYELAIDMDFSRRMRIIQKLIAASGLSKDLKERTKTTWNEVSRLSTTRNKLAHNPLVLGWRNRPADGPPDYIGIPVMKKASGERRNLVPIAEDVSVLDTIVAQSVALARDLDTLLKEIETV